MPPEIRRVDRCIAEPLIVEFPMADYKPAYAETKVTETGFRSKGDKSRQRDDILAHVTNPPG
jgi:hypothetical protein